MHLRRPSTWWPSLASRQDESFRTIWLELRQHRRIVATQSRQPGNAEGDGVLAVCAIRIPFTEELSDAIQPLTHALDVFDFVETNPVSELRITIQEIGWIVDAPVRSDEISRERLAEFVRAAAMAIGDFPGVQRHHWRVQFFCRCAVFGRAR
jgi:hypothetical protein